MRCVLRAGMCALCSDLPLTLHFAHSDCGHFDALRFVVVVSCVGCRYIFSGSDDGVAIQWSVETAEMVRKFEGDEHPCMQCMSCEWAAVWC
jgi:hypothetical protein